MSEPANSCWDFSLDKLEKQSPISILQDPRWDLASPLGISETLKGTCKDSDRSLWIREAVYENQSGDHSIPGWELADPRRNPVDP